MKKFIIVTLITLSLILLSIISIDLVSFASGNKTNSNHSDEAYLLDSSLFSKPFVNHNYTQDVIDNSKFEKVCENSNLELYVNDDSGAFRVINKATGYVWCSDVPNIERFNFNNANRKKVQSSFRLVYRDKDSKVKEVRTQDAGVVINKVVSNNTVTFKVDLTKAAISFSYKLILNDHKVNVLLEHESIVEDENKITSITLFPYLGATYKEEVPGYIFVPSGSGALIRFEQTPTISTTYQTPFYGNDANITINNEGETLSLPLYGIVHGPMQNGVLVEVKAGSTFAKFNYSPSSIENNFHFAYPSFDLRETYLLNVPSAGSILMIPENYYQEYIELEYTFLDHEDATYAGFAKVYQSSLVERGILTKQQTNDSSIPLQVEAFGKDYENGLILKKYFKMTTTKDILNINKYLNDFGIDNVFYTLKAFNKGGYSSQHVTNYKFDSSLGSLKDLKDLETYLYYNPIVSYNSRNKAPSKVLINLYNQKNYINSGVNKYKFYANVSDVIKYTKKALAQDVNLCLDGVGYLLYGDKNNKYSRLDTYNMYQKLLEDQKLPLYNPNVYMFKNTSKYLNMGLYAERLRVYTDSVPFLEILLKGYIDYYSNFLNFASNQTLDVLKCIEVGCNPAYLVTMKESYLLSETLSNNYYATTFENVKQSIVDNYKYINDALKEVINATIINHTVIDYGIYEVSYSNGKTIVVNYSNVDYNYQGYVINANGYKVI